jgi:hypothetical protein
VVLGDDLLSLALQGRRRWVTSPRSQRPRRTPRDGHRSRRPPRWRDWTTYTHGSRRTSRSGTVMSRSTTYRPRPSRLSCRGGSESHPMIRISPGEPLHKVEASQHYVLNWAAALQTDQPIAGAAPSTVLPAIDLRLIHQVVIQHLRAWPKWMHDAHDRRAGLRHAQSAALRKRWRLDVRCRSWRPPMPAGHGSRDGLRSSAGPKTGGTTADRT